MSETLQGNLLKEKERSGLIAMRRKRGLGIRTRNRIHILLMLDEGHGHRKIQKILKVSSSTIWQVRNKYHQRGWEQTVIGHKPKGRKASIPESVKQKIVEIHAQDEHLSLRAIAKKAEADGSIKSISHEKVRKILKERAENINKGKKPSDKD